MRIITVIFVLMKLFSCRDNTLPKEVLNDNLEGKRIVVNSEFTYKNSDSIFFADLYCDCFAYEQKERVESYTYYYLNSKRSVKEAIQSFDPLVRKNERHVIDSIIRVVKDVSTSTDSMYSKSHGMQPVDFFYHAQFLLVFSNGESLTYYTDSLFYLNQSKILIMNENLMHYIINELRFTSFNCYDGQSKIKYKNGRNESKKYLRKYSNKTSARASARA